MGKGVVQTLPHSQETSSEGSPTSPAVGNLGPRSAKPVKNDPRGFFARVQERMPQHVRVNHLDRVVLCHESVKDRVHRLAAGWNKANPEGPQYEVNYMPNRLWQECVIDKGY